MQKEEIENEFVKKQTEPQGFNAQLMDLASKIIEGKEELSEKKEVKQITAPSSELFGIPSKKSFVSF